MKEVKRIFFRNGQCSAVLYLFFALVFFTTLSCQSVKFNFVSEVQEQDILELESLELDLLRLRFETNTETAKKQVGEIERKISSYKNKKSVNAQYTAWLYGLEGELASILGQTERVMTSLALIQKSGGVTIWSSILTSYIEKDTAKKLRILLSPPQTPLLTLKTALVYFDADDYAASVAAFDKAFVQLPPEYAKFYQPQRDAAYQFMLNPPQNMTAKQLFAQKTLTLEQVIYAMRDHTPYLNRLMPRKNTSIPELFTLLKSENYVSTTAQLFLPLSRGETARFLSHIFAQKTGTAAMTTRAEAYKKRGRSPIPDVSLENELFPYIIFMLEKEIMELPDGRNFLPDEPIGGMEFNKSLEKMTAVW